jgi:hypothetical protein
VEIPGVPSLGGLQARHNLFTLQELLDFEPLPEYLVTNFAHRTGGFSRDHQ